MKFTVQIPGYGRYEIDTESRAEAEEQANQKRVWEGAMNALVWRSDLATKFDGLTELIADEFRDGNGVSKQLFQQRQRARLDLDFMEAK